MKGKSNKEDVSSIIGSPKNGTTSFKKQLDPKAGLGKTKSTLTSCKSSGNLNMRNLKKPDISIDTPEDSLNSMLQNQFKHSQSKPSQKNREDEKKIVSNKTSQISVKSPTNAYWKSRNICSNKEEDKTKKFVSEKDQKIKKLSDKILELEQTMTLMNKQKQKTDQILQSYKSQCQKLQEKLQSFKKVNMDNKKLIRQKAQAFKGQGQEIMKLRRQIEAMKQKKADQHKNNDKKSEELSIQVQCKHIQSHTQTEISHNQGKIEQKGLENSLCSSQQLEKMTQQIKDHYETKLAQKDGLIEQQRQLLHQQNIELNELYQKMQQGKKQIKINEKHKFSLEQYTNISELKNNLLLQIQKNEELTTQINTLTQELSRINIKLQTEYISHKHLSSNAQISNELAFVNQQNKELKHQIFGKQRNLKEKSEKIDELTKKIEQQEAIIKNLREKKPRVIIK